MKGRNKIISIMLVLAMVMATGFIMSGCGSDDPMETYKTAQENMNKADDYSTNAVVSFVIETGGQKMEMKADFDMTYIKSTSDDPADLQIAADMNVAMLGQNMNMKMYIKDKTAYSDDGTTKTKNKLDDKAIGQLTKYIANTEALDIADYVKKSSQDGDKIKMTLDTEKLMNNVLKQAGNTLKGNQNADAFKEQLKNAGLKDATVEATVKDENFKSINLTIPMEMDGSSFGTKDPVNGELVISMDNIKINTGIKEIKIPDIDQYK